MAIPRAQGGGTVRRKLWIPIHPALAKVLEACGHDGVTILQTTFGQPFTGNGLGNFMADKITRAGPPDRCVTHRIRKAAARRPAEAGCAANEIAAITGHATLQGVSRYTKAAEQSKLAVAAIRRLSIHDPCTASQPDFRGLGIPPKSHKVSRRLEHEWWSRGESNP